MNKKERIGGLRNRVTIQGVTEVQSVTGYPAETWATYATRWAGVDYATNTQSDEDELTSAKTAETTATFTLRYDATVTQKHRIVYAGLIWDIESIAPDAVREFMVLRCRNYRRTQ